MILNNATRKIESFFSEREPLICMYVCLPLKNKVRSTFVASYNYILLLLKLSFKPLELSYPSEVSSKIFIVILNF